MLDASPLFVHADAAAAAHLPVLRLFNGEMFFRDEELHTVETALQHVPLPQRRAWCAGRAAHSGVIGVLFRVRSGLRELVRVFEIVSRGCGGTSWSD